MFFLLKTISVKIEDVPNNRIPMQLSSDGKTLTVNKFYYENDTEQQRKSDIAHEIQHYIQVETEKGGGTNTEIISRSKKRQYSIQANNGKRLVLNNLTDAQLQDVLWKTEDAELSLSYLNGNDNIPQHSNGRFCLKLISLSPRNRNAPPNH